MNWATAGRLLAVFAGAGLFIADIGFDWFSKPVPNWSYWVIGLLAVGVDVKDLKEIIVSILTQKKG